MVEHVGEDAVCPVQVAVDEHVGEDEDSQANENMYSMNNKDLVNCKGCLKGFIAVLHGGSS